MPLPAAGRRGAGADPARGGLRPARPGRSRGPAGRRGRPSWRPGGPRCAACTLAPEVLGYVVDLCRATRDSPSLQLGVSPRGATALLAAARAWAWLSGRDYVTPDDVKALARPALRHRVELRPEAELEGVTADARPRRRARRRPRPPLTGGADRAGRAARAGGRRGGGAAAAVGARRAAGRPARCSRWWSLDVAPRRAGAPAAAGPRRRHRGAARRAGAGASCTVANPSVRRRARPAARRVAAQRRALPRSGTGSTSRPASSGG